MNTEQKPLYALSIDEFTALTRRIVEEVFEEKQQPKIVPIQEENQVFNIEELANFLRCSKVSIHNYKKKGMPYYRIGRKILFKRSEVLDFMKNLKKRWRMAS